MPTLLAFVSLLGGKQNPTHGRKHPSYDNKQEANELKPATPPKKEDRPVEVPGVRLVELTERSSTVMKVSEVDEYSAFDPVLNTFRVLGQLYNLAVSGEVSIVPESSYAESLVARASEESLDLLILP